MKTDIRARRVV